MAHADSGTAAVSERETGSETQHSERWVWVRRGLTLLFFVAVVGLLLRFGRSVEWDEVWRTARAHPPASLWLAAALAIVSHGLVSSYDLVGRHVTGHGLSVPRVWSVAWVSYAFNLNLGALVGGAGFRWRLYSRLGLDHGLIAQVYGLSVVTNWLGYMVLLGATLAWAPLTLPSDWQIGRQGLMALGAVLPLVALAYVLACWRARRRSWQWRKFTLELPSGRVALLQLLLSCLNWLVIAGVLYTLLGRQIDYPLVLGVTLLAAVAGAVTHVPAGLGVLEAVFVTLLASRMPQSEILAAMLSYRALYYLGPLLLAALVYAVTEIQLRRVDTKPAGAAG